MRSKTFKMLSIENNAIEYIYNFSYLDLGLGVSYKKCNLEMRLRHIMIKIKWSVLMK